MSDYNRIQSHLIHTRAAMLYDPTQILDLR